MPSATTGAVPRVSVAMITYNHENFIAQAIESVLMQETGFPVELVIGEDCSTDGTRRIVQKYAAQYPGRIRALLPQRNLGIAKNFSTVINACRSEYVAFLEGDDFWTDPGKLQIQTSFLSNHSQAALCHHRVTYLDEQSGTVVREFPPPERRMEQCSSDLLVEGNFIQTCSLIMRKNSIPQLTDDFTRLKLGDWPLCVLAGQNGWIGYIDRNMATYRLHSTSAWSSKNTDFHVAATLAMSRFLAFNLDRKHNGPWVSRWLSDMDYYLATASQSGSIGQTAVAGMKYIWYAVNLKPQILPRAILRVVRLLAGSGKRRFLR